MPCQQPGAENLGVLTGCAAAGPAYIQLRLVAGVFRGQELVSLCDELAACKVLPETLAGAAPVLEGMSGAKIRDLSLIYAAYLGRLRRDGADHRDLMEKMLERLEESGYAKDRDIYLDGFTYFTAQELHMIAIFLRTAKSFGRAWRRRSAGRPPLGGPSASKAVCRRRPASRPQVPR